MPTTPNNRRTYIRRTELFKVVPAPELLSIDVAVDHKIGRLGSFRKRSSCDFLMTKSRLPASLPCRNSPVTGSL
jgi:hypothetical protein